MICLLKIKKNKNLVNLIFISGFFIGLLLFNSVSTINSHNLLKTSIASPHASTAPISIDGNDWTTSGVASGSGTQLDPYIIANLTIVGDGSAWSWGISIKNSHVYGIIRNVSISNFFYGISIENSDTITIENSSFSNSSYSGIQLSDSNYCNITKNLMNNISVYAIYLIRSNFSVIENNTITNSLFSIYNYYSIENSIDTNYIYDNNDTGIVISNSNTCSVEKNIVDNNSCWGISIFGSDTITVNNNTLSNNGFAGMKIDSSGVTPSTNCTLSNNTIYHNDDDGIEVFRSNNNTIIGNSITYNNAHGISFDDDASSNEVTENTLIKNMYGSTIDWGTNNNIHDNTIIEMLDVSFTASESPIEVNIPVNFTDTSIGGLPTLIYSWDFGDGESSNEQNPSHNYTAPGDYNVSLTITDKDGDHSTFSMNITINEEEKSLDISGYTPTTLFAVGALMTTIIILRIKRKFSFKA